MDETSNQGEHILSIPQHGLPDDRIPGHSGDIDYQIRTTKPKNLEMRLGTEPQIQAEKPIQPVREKPPITEERRLELKRRLGEPIPVVPTESVKDFQLHKLDDGTFQIVCPTGYETKGAVNKKVQATLIERQNSRGEDAQFCVLTIPLLDGTSREVIRFEIPSPQVQAALEAIMNPPAARGREGLRRSVRRFIIPLVTAAALGIGLMGDGTTPAHAQLDEGVDHVPPAPLIVPSLPGDENKFTFVMPDPAPVADSSQAEKPEGNEALPPTILTIEQGSNRWQTIRNYLAQEFDLSGALLAQTTNSLVRFERSHSEVNDREAHFDQAGTEITLPSRQSIALLIDTLQNPGQARVDLQQAVEAVDQPKPPHAFESGQDQKAARDLERILNEISTIADGSSAAASTAPLTDSV